MSDDSWKAANYDYLQRDHDRLILALSTERDSVSRLSAEVADERCVRERLTVALVAADDLARRLEGERDGLRAEVKCPLHRPGSAHAEPVAPAGHRAALLAADVLATPCPNDRCRAVAGAMCFEGRGVICMVRLRAYQAGHRGTPRAIECTGITAKWCPVCGDCTCPGEDLDDHGCPLHSTASLHGERAPLPPGSAAPPLDVIGNLSAALAENGPAPYVQTLTRLSDAVEVVSDGPPTRTVSEILADPPRLTMSAPPGSAVAGAARGISSPGTSPVRSLKRSASPTTAP